MAASGPLAAEVLLLFAFCTLERSKVIRKSSKKTKVSVVSYLS